MRTIALYRGNSLLDSDSDRKDLAHRRRMAKKKAVVDGKIAAATEARGVLILLKGPGKGKSSSAFGTLARAIGHGQRCAVVQFIKGRTETGEFRFFNQHPQIDWHIMGSGFTWETQDRERDIAAARQAWKIAQQLLRNEQTNLLVFDEMSYMFKYGYLDVEPVVEALQSRPKMQNVIITGRSMATPLQAIADTISVVQNERHAFKQGVGAQPGIEY